MYDVISIAAKDSAKVLVGLRFGEILTLDQLVSECKIRAVRGLLQSLADVTKPLGRGPFILFGGA